ncbi:mitochondrial calcium uniporter regulator 1-like [Haliotis rufescens]|uniref:mitochondrial calcium uniporter regulator 1-like n=1 Tax=Haliotis rufescens TaxID=6454 RepID=UPI00201EE4D3|nr:mitochondrial calcium uniporter regulator 1-like [Haliotis rufescens]
MKGMTMARLCRRHMLLLHEAHKQLSTCRRVHGKGSQTPTVAAAQQSEPFLNRPKAVAAVDMVEVSPTMTTASKIDSTEAQVVPESTVAYDVWQVDPATVKEIYFFNTLELVKKLEQQGFTREQSEGMTGCLVDIVNTTIKHQSNHMISKSEQEIRVQQLMAEISSVKKDMVMLQKSEFSSLRNQTEKQSFEIRQIKDSLRDEIGKLKGQMTLDINLERSRAVEAHAENQKNLTQLNQKIETQIAHLLTKYEIYRNDVLKFAGGTVLTCAGLCLGIIRVWS